MEQLIILLITTVVLLLIIYKISYVTCPANKLLIVDGLISNTNEYGAEVYAGGSKFIFPIIQKYNFIDLSIYTFEFDEKLYTKDDIPLVTKLKITYGISNDPTLSKNAAMFLLGMENEEIMKLSSDIIYDHLTKFIKTNDIIDIIHFKRNNQLVDQFYSVLNNELNKIGIEIVNINLKSINNFMDQILALESKYNDLNLQNQSQIGSQQIQNSELEDLNQKIDQNIKKHNELLDLKLKLLIRLNN